MFAVTNSYVNIFVCMFYLKVTEKICNILWDPTFTDGVSERPSSLQHSRASNKNLYAHKLWTLYDVWLFSKTRCYTDEGEIIFCDAHKTHIVYLKVSIGIYKYVGRIYRHIYIYKFKIFFFHLYTPLNSFVV